MKNTSARILVSSPNFIIIIDTCNVSIASLIPTDGSITTSVFYNVVSLASDYEGNVYVGDSSAVRLITNTSVVTLAGTPDLLDYPIDGSGASAVFYFIQFIAFNYNNPTALYIGDGNDIIRKVGCYQDYPLTSGFCFTPTPAPTSMPTMQPTQPSAIPTALPTVATISSSESSTVPKMLLLKSIIPSVLGFFILTIALGYVWLTCLSAAAKQRKQRQMVLLQLPVHRLLVERASDNDIILAIQAHIDTLFLEDFDGQNAFEIAHVHGCSMDVMFEIMKSFLPSPEASHHTFAWTTLVQFDKYEKVVERIVQDHKHLAFLLAYSEDEQGRAAIHVASKECKRIIKESLHFMKRYEIDDMKPIHVSATSMIYRAIDQRSDVENPQRVALKFMYDRNQFKREVDVRKLHKFDDAYILNILHYYDGDEDAFSLMEVQRRGWGQYRYCLVLPLAEKDLEDIMLHDHVAGIDWLQIKLITVQISLALSHLHEHDVVHGDIKPKNLMKMNNKMKIIDLDSTGREGTTFDDSKYSTAYLPPELITSHNGRLRLIEDSICTKSRDVWALGVLLFKLFSESSLFPSNISDNIDLEDLDVLYEFSDEYKTKKLIKVANKEARNLVSLLLMKDPLRRPSMKQILSHPFLTGRNIPRLIGEEAEFDCFISYRVKTDIELAEGVYNRLTDAGLRVWWDKRCLEPGIPWNEGFCNGLIKSRIFVPIISRSSINHPSDAKCNFSKLESNSSCDNVLLEYSLALELRSREYIEKIFPIFFGDPRPGDCFGSYFDDGCHPIDVKDIVVDSVHKALVFHLDRLSLGSIMADTITVRGVLDTVCINQGKVVESSLTAALEEIANAITSM